MLSGSLGDTRRTNASMFVGSSVASNNDRAYDRIYEGVSNIVNHISPRLRFMFRKLSRLDLVSSRCRHPTRMCSS